MPPGKAITTSGYRLQYSSCHTHQYRVRYRCAQAKNVIIFFKKNLRIGVKILFFHPGVFSKYIFFDGNQATSWRRGIAEPMAGDAKAMFQKIKRAREPFNCSWFVGLKITYGRGCSRRALPWFHCDDLGLFCAGGAHDGKHSLFKQIEMKLENDEEANSIFGPAISYSYCDVMDLKKYHKEPIGTLVLLCVCFFNWWFSISSLCNRFPGKS